MIYVVTSNYYDAYAPIAVIKVPDEADLQRHECVALVKCWKERYKKGCPYVQVIHEWCKSNEGYEWLDAKELWVDGNIVIRNLGE